MLHAFSPQHFEHYCKGQECSKSWEIFVFAFCIGANHKSHKLGWHVPQTPACTHREECFANCCTCFLPVAMLTPMAWTPYGTHERSSKGLVYRVNMFVQHVRITAVGAILAQHVKTTPRRVRNYAAKSLAFSNAKRSALIYKQHYAAHISKLRRGIRIPSNVFHHFLVPLQRLRYHT